MITMMMMIDQRVKNVKKNSNKLFTGQVSELGFLKNE